MPWPALLSLCALAAPPSSEPDLRRLHDARRIEVIAQTLADTPPDTWIPQALTELQDPDLLPHRRALLVEALSTPGAAPLPAEDLAEMLLAPGDSPLALRQRIDAAAILAARHPPEAAGPLLVAFARSRAAADLAEDPDVFERALRGAIAIGREDPAALRRALEADLAPLLLHLARLRLREQWLLPLFGERDLPHLPPDNADLRARLTQTLLDAWEAHGIALIEAMQTERGSLLQGALEVAEDALLAAGTTHDPRLAQVRAQRPPPAEAPLAPPEHPPGSAPGYRLLETPRESAAAAWSFPPPRPAPLLPVLLGGLALSGASLLLARRARRLAAVGLGLSVLLLAEGALQIAGVQALADTRPLFRFADWEVEVVVEQGSRRVTPGGWIRYQDIDPSPADFRAVTLGASSAHGSNHLREESFSALLEQRLRRRWPDHTIEVLNFGIGGTTSDGVRIAGLEALSLGADLLLVYYGHNEVAQFTRLPHFTDASPRRLAAQRRLRQSAIYTLLASLLPSPAPIRDGVTKGITIDIERYRALAEENLRHNLGVLLRAAAQHDARVVLMNPATNYPFAELSWPEGDPPPPSLEDAHALRGEGRLEEALQAAQGSRHPEALRLQAELLAETGHPDEARAHMQAAIDASLQPGVITSPIRQALRDLSKRHGAPMLDVDRLFGAASPDGLHAPGLFWDDLHPTREGHARIAEALFPVVSALVEDRIAPEPPP